MEKIKCLSKVLALFFILTLGDNTYAQMIANITEPVQTDFGIYQPYNSLFTPNVPPFQIEADFSNIGNFSWVSLHNKFTSADSTLLLQNHFTVKKSSFTQLYDVYNESTHDGIPLFITTDAVLHIYHTLFDHLLSEIEVQKLTVVLEHLTDTLIINAEIVYNEAEDTDVKEAARLNLAFFSVAKKLLKGTDATIPESVSDLVNAELELILNHDGFYFSPIFGEFSLMDYSQFKVRGHYTKSDNLEAYFKTMMWYGWTIFTMEPELFGLIPRRHTLQAILLVQMLNNAELNDQSVLDLWESIYTSTVFFVGKTDDPCVREYKMIAEEVYGSDFLALSPDSLADSSLLDAYMIEAQKLPEPKIPNRIPGTLTTYKGFRFMGQRFIPDSCMFAHLVYPDVGSFGSPRSMPKSLDIMAVLGSERAYTLLDSVYGETAYENYSEKIAEFRTEFSEKNPEDWAQNLYWNWLYCLMPLLYEKTEGYPLFMQTTAWSDKELLTALASWTELRHDTILYAKQSYSTYGTLDINKSYVEPNPHIYARLASLVGYTRNGLASRGLLIDEYREKLDLFEYLLLFLRDVAIKELKNVPLSELEYDNLLCFGKVMEDIISDVDDTDNMAVIADVHTEAEQKICLEEGVGYPLDIYVIINEGGTIRITRGAIFSYFEFTQPVSERLTDEDWQYMLSECSQPSLPEWVSSFMDASSAWTELSTYSPSFQSDKEFVGIEQDNRDNLPEEICLLQNYPNPFNPETTIKFIIPEASHVTITILNTLGQKVITLFEGQKNAGSHMIVWNGRDAFGQQVSSGMYLCRVRSGNNLKVKRMLLMR